MVSCAKQRAPFGLGTGGGGGVGLVGQRLRKPRAPPGALKAASSPPSLPCFSSSLVHWILHSFACLFILPASPWHSSNTTRCQTGPSSWDGIGELTSTLWPTKGCLLAALVTGMSALEAGRWGSSPACFPSWSSCTSLGILPLQGHQVHLAIPSPCPPPGHPRPHRLLLSGLSLP